MCSFLYFLSDRVLSFGVAFCGHLGCLMLYWEVGLMGLSDTVSVAVCT
jgi:hypothetical protein